MHRHEPPAGPPGRVQQWRLDNVAAVRGRVNASSARKPVRSAGGAVDDQSRAFAVASTEDGDAERLARSHGRVESEAAADL